MAKVMMQKVQSSNIQSIGYNEDKKELFIEFKNKGDNSTYMYRGVPSEKYDDMINAESIGRFFHAKIKGKYTFKKLSE